MANSGRPIILRVMNSSQYECQHEINTKGIITWTAMNSHLCVMIGASVALSQSQHIGVSHYLPMWLRTKEV